jgi:hypothetical protein
MLHLPASLPRGIEGRVDPGASLDDMEKRKFLNLRRLELRPLGRPARSQSLYRLRFFFIWFVRLLALRALLVYCASLG